MMWNGDLDCNVPYQQMATMKAAIAARGGTQVQTNIAVGYGHSILNATLEDSMSKFLYSILSH
jgi:hypothetical protein